ncbi:DUF342 domain-containing protein [Alkalicoccus luteus]|uniref:DUF342 domain-containing protein n=1 Tax=Alkalicoccus luteus TaxID=1237094 RepID=UPI0040343918
MEELEGAAIIISAGEMEAVIRPGPDGIPPGVPVAAMEEMLQMSGVAFGISAEVLQQIHTNGCGTEVTVATGLPPVKGKDAYMRLPEQKIQDHEQAGQVNLRHVTDIWMASKDDEVGEKVKAELGKPGTTVTGNTVEPAPGKDFKLRPGKNTVLSDDGLKVIAAADGQISVDRRLVHINPVFEVNGDLDMSTGNISFNGNIVIHGSVPSGYRLEAEGDIYIHGAVEAAYIKSGGSVYVKYGVNGAGNGTVCADKDVEASFLNEADVTALGSVYIKKEVRHSRVEAGAFFTCTKGAGLVSGGTVSAGTEASMNVLGNRLYTKTDVYCGVSARVSAQKKRYDEQLAENRKKLKQLVLIRNTGAAPAERVAAAMRESAQLIRLAEDRLEALDHESDSGAILVYKTVYPNVTFHAGKYSRTVQSESGGMHVSLRDGELSSDYIRHPVPG